MSGPSQSVQIEEAVRLVPASRFTIEQLTQAYNQTRVDYLVPMPMNAARLAEYIHTYDVDLDASYVAVEHETMLGLGMLGVRPGCSWVTRLGVLPTSRKHGIGRMLMAGLLENSDRRGLPRTVLEVIKNNLPAYNLFIRCGFQPIHELLILRRAPGPPPFPPEGDAAWRGRDGALELLEERSDVTSWITETESLAHAENVHALTLEWAAGGRGWLVFQEQKLRGLTLLLSRLTLHTEGGDPVAIARMLFAHLYTRYADLDTHTENVAEHDPRLPAYLELGFFESFRRIEMRRTLGSQAA
jgi:ribosomal protein S18 acetylase RimI-like enzyme